METETLRLKVRCCCQPVKVYGTLPVARERLFAGALVTYPLQIPAPLELPAGIGPESASGFDQLELEVARFTPGPGCKPELALKYEGDQSLEHKLCTLRRIAAFQLDRELAVSLLRVPITEPLGRLARDMVKIDDVPSPAATALDRLRWLQRTYERADAPLHTSVVFRQAFLGELFEAIDELQAEWDKRWLAGAGVERVRVSPALRDARPTPLADRLRTSARDIYQSYSPIDSGNSAIDPVACMLEAADVLDRLEAEQ